MLKSTDNIRQIIVIVTGIVIVLLLLPYLGVLKLSTPTMMSIVEKPNDKNLANVKRKRRNVREPPTSNGDKEMGTKKENLIDIEKLLGTSK